MKTILSAALAVMLVLSAMDAGAQDKAADRKVELAIEQQSLADALNEWAKQTGLQLVSSSSETMNRTLAPRIKGAYTAQRALDELLKGTSLTYEWVSERAVAIREKPLTLPAALQSGTEDPKQAIVPIARFGGEPRGEQRLAVNDQSAAGGAGPPARDHRQRDVESLEVVVVTGTHIAGSASAGSRVITLNRDYIAKSGYATVEGLLKTIPQNFNGGVGQGQAPQLADPNAGNVGGGTAINLRGLGADSTLVLIDGRRQPAGGYYGSFVDISSIPTSAIERVEVLPDGASAIYGSDAVAGVVNFILRKDFDGAESQVRYGGAEGGADQVQFSQILGHSWSTGNAIVGYQYDDRGRLQRIKRAYTASDDLRPFGGSDYRVSFSNPGNIVDPETLQPVFAVPAGQDGTSLAADDFLPGAINYDTSSSGADLLPDQEIHSGFLNASQRIGDRYEIFGTGRFATRKTTRVLNGADSFLNVPSSNAFFVDPFGGSESVIVKYKFTDDLGPQVTEGKVDTYVGTAGMKAQLPGDWQVSLSGTYGHEDTRSLGKNLVDIARLNVALADSNPATAFNPFADGSNTNASTLAAIRRTAELAADSRTRNATAIFSGPLFPVGEGTSMLALGVDFHDEDIRASEDAVSTLNMGRNVKAAFAEMRLPIITSGKHPALRELGFSLAGRYEDYSDFGSTFDHRVGVTWAPAESFAVRASWGTSFKAPGLNQLVGTYPDTFVTYFPFPSPEGDVNALFRFGSNPDLSEETADVWSGGIEWTPVAVPSFRASLSFWRIEYTDKVAIPGPTDNPLGVLFEEDQWARLINRNPTRAQVDAICRDPSFVNELNPLSVDQCLELTPDAIIDLRLTNLARVTVEGVDVEAQYRFDTRAGAITLGLNGVYTPSYETQVTGNSPKVDVSNTTGNLLRLRLRGEASWRNGGWQVATFINYANSYEDTFSVADQPIKEFTTVDGSVSYQFEDSRSALSGATVALHALNIFDQNPPFANVGVPNVGSGYDTTNADPFGRVLSLQVSKVWGRGE